MAFVFTLFRGMKPFSQLAFTAFLAVTLFLASMVVALLLAFPLFGYDEIMQIFSSPALTDPAAIRILKYFQLFQTIGLFLLPAILAAFFFSAKPVAYLQLGRMFSLRQGLLVLLLVFAVNPFINFSGYLNAEMHLPGWMEPLEEWIRETEEQTAALMEAFLTTSGVWGLLFNLFMVAVLPALGEELLFRGVIQKILIRWTGQVHGGIWLAAALFSALHMQFLGFIPRLLLGVLFGYLLVWSGSLWLPILAHFINNAGAVAALWCIDKGWLNPALEDFGAGPGQWVWALVSLLVSLLLVSLLGNRSRGLAGNGKEQPEGTGAGQPPPAGDSGRS